MSKSTLVLEGLRKPVTRREKTLRMVMMAMLAAISIILVIPSIPLFPAAPFLEYDAADVPVLLGAFTLGPAAGLLILLVASTIQAFLLGGNGWIGLLMHFIASGALIIISSLIYNRGKCTLKALILGLIAGAVTMTLVMIPLNFIFIPKLMFNAPLGDSVGLMFDAIFSRSSSYSEGAHIGYNAVKGILYIAIIPFNLAKAGINSVLFFILHKSLGVFLQSSGKKKEEGV